MNSRAALFLALILAGTGWAGKKVSLGKPAPDFSLSGFSSEEPVTLSGLKGRVVFVDFWASWCMPCRRLMPRVYQIKERFPEVEVIAISVDASREKAITFLRAVEPGLKALHDTGQRVADAYGVERMPSSFVIDKQGLLRFRHDGYDAKALDAVERQLRLLLDEP